MRVIIVDDELNARLALRGILEENFPEIEIVAENGDVPTAVKSIHSFQPELVFLDIAMPGYSGLELLNFFEKNSVRFKIIFVTAYSEYAINAFELSAVDYILKPVRIDALQRALSKIDDSKTKESLELLRHNIEIPQNKKIALNTGDGITFIALSDILYLKADGSYTHFFLADKTKITISKKIAEFERLEQAANFMRIHRSHVINLERIRKILKQDGGIVIMDNGDELSVSVERKATLLDKFKSFRF